MNGLFGLVLIQQLFTITMRSLEVVVGVADFENVPVSKEEKKTLQYSRRRSSVESRLSQINVVDINNVFLTTVISGLRGQTLWISMRHGELKLKYLQPHGTNVNSEFKSGILVQWGRLGVRL